MANMTAAEIEMMRGSKTEAEWNANCNTVKTAHGGYPADWFTKIIMSGLMAATAAKFGSTDKIQVL